MYRQEYRPSREEYAAINQSKRLRLGLLIEYQTELIKRMFPRGELLHYRK